MSDYTITIDLNGRMGKVIVPTDANRAELQMMKEFLCKAIDTRIESAKVKEVKANPLKASIYDMDLSVRLTNVLIRSGCNTVADVLSHSKSEIRYFRNMGVKAYKECLEVFGAFGEFKADDEGAEE